MSLASVLSGVGGILSTGSNLYDTVSGLISNPSIAGAQGLGSVLSSAGSTLRGGTSAPASTLLSQTMPQPQVAAPASPVSSLNLNVWLPVGAVVLVVLVLVVSLCNKK